MSARSSTVSAAGTAGGRGNSHTPMRVTMPKFDCVNSPSRIGPKLYFEVCQLIRSLESSAPSPVRSSSPLPSTISSPQENPK